MIIKRRHIKADVIRVTKDMRKAIGTQILEIVFSDVVVMIPLEYNTEKVVKALDAIGSLLRELAVLEEEDIEAEIKKVLNDY